MIILQNESDRIKIDFPELSISPTLEIEEKDQSGDASSGASAPGGIKPWAIAISCLIPAEQAASIKSVIRAARKVGADLMPVTWLVTHDDLNALDILQVKFCGQISVKKSDSLFATTLTFSLKEVASVAERTETKILAESVKINGDNIGDQTDMSEVIAKVTDKLYFPYAQNSNINTSPVTIA